MTLINSWDELNYDMHPFAPHRLRRACTFSVAKRLILWISLEVRAHKCKFLINGAVVCDSSQCNVPVTLITGRLRQNRRFEGRVLIYTALSAS